MLTVKSLLEIINVPWYKVLYGDALLNEKEIEHISVTEYPVENFVKKNEMILSTAAGLDNKEMFFEFVMHLHESEASCLFIARPSDQLDVPQRVIEYLEENAPFPVILLPWECRFADIIKLVLDLLRNDAITEHNQFMDIQNQLLQAYLSNQDLKQAAHILSRFFHSKIVILDAHNEIKSQSHPVADQERLLSAILANDNNCLYPIIANEQMYGNVHMEPLSEGLSYDKNLFSYYLSWTLALWFDKERVIQISNQSLKDDFIWQLASSKQEEFGELCEKGRNLGLNLESSFFCAVSNIYLNGTEKQPVSDIWLKDNILALKAEIMRTADLYQWETMVTYQQGNLLMFIENSDGFSIDTYLITLWKRLYAVFPQIYFSCGVSEPGGNPPDFNKLYHDARLALNLCTPKIGENTYLKFKRTALHSVLAYLSSDKNMMDTIQSILEPVYEYDKLMRSDDLINTLKCYLECKNLSEAARLLYLHRHSLTYRLNKIEELTGLSIKDPDDFFLLELCVRMNQK